MDCDWKSYNRTQNDESCFGIHLFQMANSKVSFQSYQEKLPLSQTRIKISTYLSHSAHRTSNFTNPEFQFPQFEVLQSVFCLSTYFVSKYWQDKSFESKPKYIIKFQYNFLLKKEKETLCNTLNWGNWNSGFVKLGVRWAERDT